MKDMNKKSEIGAILTYRTKAKLTDFGAVNNDLHLIWSYHVIFFVGRMDDAMQSASRYLKTVGSLVNFSIVAGMGANFDHEISAASKNFDKPKLIRVEVKNQILGNSIFWEGKPDDIAQINNVFARECAQDVADDGVARICGMWRVCGIA